jgi:spermidine synthase
MPLALYLLFLFSGCAGLIYESVWTRYLGLFVGHDAYAQIIVLVIFLGGMSLGAAAVSRLSERWAQPLYGYVAAEFAVGCIGLFFQDVFQGVTSWAYAGVYPALHGGLAVSAAKWSIAGALILPQSVLLGATFPLMSAGALRLVPRRPGRTLSLLYFSNSLGAAVGVLLAGFWLVEIAGLPGTLLVAAMLNLAVATGTILVIARARGQGAERAAGPVSLKPSARVAAEGSAPAPTGLLLFTAFGTAVASFVYEIDWIRMLSLVLGSATHSFELMLSAFILGLALGAWWIRSRADGVVDPIRTLGIVQWAMGCLALATLPLYLQSFGWTSSLLSTFARTDAGYTGFTLARYGICLAVMLPATFCAGMTLPLITRTLLTGGVGERAIGAVYAWNTLGSILGVVLGGLVLLPVLGLKGMLVAGAVLDMAIGVVLLVRAARPAAGVARRGTRRLAVAAALGTVAVAAVAMGTARFDEGLLVSGVFRSGNLGSPGDRELRFYRDGRTATVSAVRYASTGAISLATNGKPDASLPLVWFRPCDAGTPREALSADAATQTLLPLVTLAHAPLARTAAVIGQGSGMSSHLLLSSDSLQELVTIEIEPQMVAGSRVFYPANRRAFDDPRSHHVIDDAKSYFASAQRRYDLIMSEPSNPWVSGVSGLFTDEFYGRIRGYLSDDGVFGQWLHVYELDDGLVLSVLAGIHRNFRSYEIYLVPRGDILVVASNRPALPRPDWSIMRSPKLEADLCHFIMPNAATLDALHLAGRNDLAPVLESFGQPNSDYYPVLDLGAERRRFRRDLAAGFPGLSTDWYNLLSSASNRRSDASAPIVAAFPDNPRVHARALAAMLRDSAGAGAADTAMQAAVRQARFQWALWNAATREGATPASWELWVKQANEVDRALNGGTAGAADERLYGTLLGFLDRHRAPEAARDVVRFRHGLAAWKFEEAAGAAARLVPLTAAGAQWLPADELRDGAVMANLHLGNVAAARQIYDSLRGRSQRKPDDLRSRLLEAYVLTAERGEKVAVRSEK